MGGSGNHSFSFLFCLSSVVDVLIHLSRWRFLLMILFIYSQQCSAFQLAVPQPEDTSSQTIFTGGALSLSWIINVSDPSEFDLLLVGVRDGKTVFPGINSADSPLSLLVNFSPQ
ncbi:hypothetical protein B0H10DRAFT_2039438 [Mycena sp. CBHHK59/15]|nr:hypothetical protein B0H10DRAFT_2039438 [Mycena sp. CBHHK59/15]